MSKQSRAELRTAIFETMMVQGRRGAAYNDRTLALMRQNHGPRIAAAREYLVELGLKKLIAELSLRSTRSLENSDQFAIPGVPGAPCWVSFVGSNGRRGYKLSSRATLAEIVSAGTRAAPGEGESSRRRRLYQAAQALIKAGADPNSTMRDHAE